MKIDVRYKLLLLILISIASFLVKDLLYGSILFAVVCIITLSMGQRFSMLKYILIYIMLVIFELLAPYIPKILQSTLLMLTLCLRMFMPMILYARTFITTTSVSEIITAMYSMKIPPPLTITLAVTMRFFPSAKEELNFINDAMKLRGFNLSLKNLFTQPGLIFEGMMTPMMMRASTIAEELSAASITRGIDNPNPRTSFNKLKITIKDTVLTISFLLMISSVIAIKYIL